MKIIKIILSLLVISSCNNLPETREEFEDLVDSLDRIGYKEESIYICHQMLGKTNFDSLIIKELAFLYSRKGNYKIAHKYYKQLNLQNKDNVFELIESFRDISQHDSVIYYYEKYFPLKSGLTNPVAYYFALVNEKKFLKADQFYKDEIIDIISGGYEHGHCFARESEFWISLPQAEVLIGLEKYQEALNHINHLERLILDNYRLHYLKSIAYDKLDEYTNSEKYRKLAEKLNPDLDSLSSILKGKIVPYYY